ncbi:MAG TPA: VCBS repeat-containing protein, partial [Agriterribacter sp.]|nr:VCBS repeat-containing protein [Agriterribacter sp.]
MALIEKYPEIKIPDQFYKNNGELQFSDMNDAVRNSRATYSNGAVYADFDNDGDLDIVVSNINDDALLYENTTRKSGNKDFVEIKLNGPEKNRNAIGAKLIVFTDNGIRTYENNPEKGFMSSMQIPLHVGLENATVDSAFLVWPDNSFQNVRINVSTPHSEFTYHQGLSLFNYSWITGFHKNEGKRIINIAGDAGLNYCHIENQFNEFEREPLMAHMLSREGPALAVADINHDGLEDIFIGSAKTFKNAMYVQRPNGSFIQTDQPALMADSMYEDVDATWADVNNDGNMDLIVASGGNEYYGNDEHLLPRIYLNDGKANFKRSQNAFTRPLVNASCIAACDFNGDGWVDLFVGGRSVPWNYGDTPSSYLLLNDGAGRFSDVTDDYAKGLSKIGMVTGAVWIDIDGDGDTDLVVCCEWGAISAFINNQGRFERKSITDKKGWWNFILPVDIDGDGDMDMVAGNLGLNSRLQASSIEPVRLYWNDFDNNGKKEQVITYYLGGKEIPLPGKDELQKQMPGLKKKYMYAGDFAKASLKDIFSADKIDQAKVLSADYFSNALLKNEGNGNFSIEPLPWNAQLSTYRTAAIVNANDDSLPDILLGGNYYDSNIASGRYDADCGTILMNRGNGKLVCESLNGLVIRGQVRHISPVKIAGEDAFILARNDDTAAVLKFTTPGQ